MRFGCRLTWSVWLSLVLTSPGRAWQTADLHSQVDQLVKPLIDSGSVVGLVVGLNCQGDTEAWGYGRVAHDSSQTPDGRTVFEIGSATKLFTALALAEMAQEDLVRLDDPVSTLLPETVRVPLRDGREITLIDLATHTSGLPRLPKNLFRQIAAHPDNPYVEYTVADLYDGLATTTLASTPGQRYAYSNFGMGLLGHALARRVGVDYETLISTRLCEPLGLQDTRVTLGETLRARMAQGHDLDGQPVPAWDLAALVGAGGLHSTAEDLLLFLSANLGLGPRRLAAAIETTHMPRHELNDSMSIALGWHLNTKEKVLWHNGQTGGFQCHMAFEKEQKVGVVILSNTTCELIDPLGRQVMRLLLGLPAQHLKVRMPIPLTPATLDKYVGKYPLVPGFEIVIFRDGERLLAQATNQPALRIYPESETEFFYRAVDARITFVKDKQGEISKLILHQNGLDLPAWKGGLSVRLGTGLFKSLFGKPENAAQPR